MPVLPKMNMKSKPRTYSENPGRTSMFSSFWIPYWAVLLKDTLNTALTGTPRYLSLFISKQWFFFFFCTFSLQKTEWRVLGDLKGLQIYTVPLPLPYSPQPFSSLLSEQSSTWLQTRPISMQCPLSHRNWWGGHVGSGVWHRCSCSSDPSPQSLSSSQTKYLGIHRPFWHVNWFALQGGYEQPLSSL